MDINPEQDLANLGYTQGENGIWTGSNPNLPETYDANLSWYSQYPHSPGFEPKVSPLDRNKWEKKQKSEFNKELKAYNQRIQNARDYYSQGMPRMSGMPDSMIKEETGEEYSSEPEDTANYFFGEGNWKVSEGGGRYLPIDVEKAISLPQTWHDDKVPVKPEFKLNEDEWNKLTDKYNEETEHHNRWEENKKNYEKYSPKFENLKKVLQKSSAMEAQYLLPKLEKHLVDTGEYLPGMEEYSFEGLEPEDEEKLNKFLANSDGKYIRGYTLTVPKEINPMDELRSYFEEGLSYDTDSILNILKSDDTIENKVEEINKLEGEDVVHEEGNDIAINGTDETVEDVLEQAIPEVGDTGEEDKTEEQEQQMASALQQAFGYNGPAMSDEDFLYNAASWAGVPSREQFDAYNTGINYDDLDWFEYDEPDGTVSYFPQPKAQTGFNPKSVMNVEEDETEEDETEEDETEEDEIREAQKNREFKEKIATMSASDLYKSWDGQDTQTIVDEIGTNYPIIYNRISGRIGDFDGSNTNAWNIAVKMKLGGMRWFEFDNRDLNDYFTAMENKGQDYLNQASDLGHKIWNNGGNWTSESRSEMGRLALKGGSLLGHATKHKSLILALNERGIDLNSLDEDVRDELLKIQHPNQKGNRNGNLQNRISKYNSQIDDVLNGGKIQEPVDLSWTEDLKSTGSDKLDEIQETVGTEIPKDVADGLDKDWAYEQFEKYAKKIEELMLNRKREKVSEEELEQMTADDQYAMGSEENNYLPPDFLLPPKTTTWSGDDFEWDEDDKAWYESWMNRKGGLPVVSNNQVGPARFLRKEKYMGWVDDVTKDPKTKKKLTKPQLKFLKWLRLGTFPAVNMAVGKPEGDASWNYGSIGNMKADEVQDSSNPIKSGVSSKSLATPSSGGGHAHVGSGIKFGISDRAVESYNSKASRIDTEPLEADRDPNEAKFSGTTNTGSMPSGIAKTLGRLGLGSTSKNKISVKGTSLPKTGGSSASSGSGSSSRPNMNAYDKNANLELEELIGKIKRMATSWDKDEQGMYDSGSRYLPFKFFVKDDVYMSMAGSGHRKSRIESFIRRQPDLLDRIKQILK